MAEERAGILALQTEIRERRESETLDIETLGKAAAGVTTKAKRQSMQVTQQDLRLVDVLKYQLASQAFNEVVIPALEAKFGLLHRCVCCYSDVAVSRDSYAGLYWLCARCNHQTCSTGQCVLHPSRKVYFPELAVTPGPVPEPAEISKLFEPDPMAMVCRPLAALG